VGGAGVRAVVVDAWRLATGSRIVALKPSHILVRVAYARLTELDTAVAVNPHFYREGRVVGFSGVGFAVEHGADVEGKLQGPVTIRGFRSDFAPPLEGDGFAAEYTPVPAGLAVPLSRVEPRYSYLVDACIALDAYQAISRYADGRVLLVGGGPSSIALAIKLVEAGYHVEALVHGELCRRVMREEAGAHVLEGAMGPLEGRYGAVYISSPTYMLSWGVEGLEARVFILHPHIHLSTRLLRLPRSVGKVVVGVAWGVEAGLGPCMGLLEKLWRAIGDHVPVVAGLNPPPEPGCLGLILDVRASP
jgi:hypothetical protein